MVKKRTKSKIRKRQITVNRTGFGCPVRGMTTRRKTLSEIYEAIPIGIENDSYSTDPFSGKRGSESFRIHKKMIHSPSRIYLYEKPSNKHKFGKIRTVKWKPVSMGIKTVQKGISSDSEHTIITHQAELVHNKKIQKLTLHQIISKYTEELNAYLNKELTFDEVRRACVESDLLCMSLVKGIVTYDGKVIKIASYNDERTSNNSINNNITPPNNNNGGNDGNNGDDESDEEPEYYEILKKIPTIAIGDSKIYDTPLGGTADERAGDALKRYAQELKLKDIELSIITKINSGDISKIFKNKLQTATNKYKALIIALRLVPARANYILGKIGISLSFVTSKEDKLLLGYIYTAPFDAMVTVKWCNDNLIKNGCSPLIKHRGK